MSLAGKLHIGKNNNRWGAKHSEETKRKLSEIKKKKPSPSQFKKGHKVFGNAGKIGKNNPNWRGGNSFWRRRQRAKRRTYGFEPINEEFNNSEGHHIDRKHIVFIPKELHRSVWHSLDKPETMDKINTKVICWLLGKIN